MKILNKENKFIKEALIEKSDEINNYVDCDVIQECRNEVFKTIYNEELKENAVALINAIAYRIGMEDKRVKYMVSIMKEIDENIKNERSQGYVDASIDALKKETSLYEAIKNKDMKKVVELENIAKNGGIIRIM